MDEVKSQVHAKGVPSSDRKFSRFLFDSSLYPIQIPPVGPEVLVPGVFGAAAAGSWLTKDLVKATGKRVAARQEEKEKSYNAVRDALEEIPDELMNPESGCRSIWELYENQDNSNEDYLSLK